MNPRLYVDYADIQVEGRSLLNILEEVSYEEVEDSIDLKLRLMDLSGLLHSLYESLIWTTQLRVFSEMEKDLEEGSVVQQLAARMSAIYPTKSPSHESIHILAGPYPELAIFLRVIKDTKVACLGPKDSCTKYWALVRDEVLKWSGERCDQSVYKDVEEYAEVHLFCSARKASLQ
jgi:hypothetical protein